MNLPQLKIGNILLRTMPAEDYALLAPNLRRIALPVHLQLHEAGRKFEQIYFPEDGIISIVAVTLDGVQREVGLVGREGMSETAIVLGIDHSPHGAYVQGAGASSLELRTEALEEAMGRSTTLRLHLLKYVQAMMIQLSTTIAAGDQKIDQRLARWFLMCHDRVEGEVVHLTHEYIAMMLAVRRAGVTNAMKMLSGEGLIIAKRGRIHIRDRLGLEKLAAGGYGLAEAEYERLVGVALSRAPHDPSRETIGSPE